jgi:hypothetical protein
MGSGVGGVTGSRMDSLDILHHTSSSINNPSN